MSENAHLWNTIVKHVTVRQTSLKSGERIPKEAVGKLLVILVGNKDHSFVQRKLSGKERTCLFVRTD